MDSKTIKLKKTIIDVYKSQLYPTDLYISKKWDKKDIMSRFEGIDEKDLDTIGKGLMYYNLKDKTTDKYICLILIDEDKHDDIHDKIDTIAHECCHYALDLFNFIGSKDCMNEQEPICYLLGWAVSCAYKTLMK